MKSKKVVGASDYRKLGEALVRRLEAMTGQDSGGELTISVEEPGWVHVSPDDREGDEIEKLLDKASFYLAYEGDVDARRCAGCDSTATSEDMEGVPLCDDCYDEAPHADECPCKMHH